MNSQIDIRDAFFEQVYNLAQKDPNVIFITDDMDAFVLKKFKQNLSEQFINIGVAEQNMIDVAAGLAACGKKVYAFGICSYVTMRCFEQIKFSVCSMNLPVTIVGIGAGFSFGFDGPTHHGTQDIAIMRVLPEIQILNPVDALSAQESANIAYNSNKPTYIRIDKGVFKPIYTSLKQVKTGYSIIKPLTQKNIVTTGFMTHVVRQALEESNIQKFGLIDLSMIKPFPKSFYTKIIEKSKLVAVIEENSIIGGIGTAIAETAVDKNYSGKILRFALKDHQFLDYGDREWLLKLNNLNKESIIKLLRKL